MKIAATAKMFAGFFVIGLLPFIANGQERADFVSDASHIVGTYQPAEVSHSTEAQLKAANALLELMDDKQKVELLHSLDSNERREWTNLPAPPNAGGIRLGDMDKNEVKAVCDLMATLYSEQGYQKMVNIMLADDNCCEVAKLVVVLEPRIFRS